MIFFISARILPNTTDAGAPVVLVCVEWKVAQAYFSLLSSAFTSAVTSVLSVVLM